MRILLALCLLLIAAPSDAASFTMVGVIHCTGSDQVVSLPGRADKYSPGVLGFLGAGVMPPQFTITGVEVTSETAGYNDYTVVGKLDVAGTGGDYISPFFHGHGNSGVTWFPVDVRPVFKLGDELHIHATCSSGGGVVFATIFYQ